MLEKPKKIEFKNNQNPNAGFDIIRIEDIYSRETTDHSPYKPHLVKFFVIMIIEDGKGFHSIDFEDYQCTQGTILTIRKDQIHKFFRHSDLQGKLLVFTDTFLVSFLEEMEFQKSILLFNEQFGVPKLQLTLEQFVLTKNIIQRINKEYFEINDAYSLSIIRSELHILITQLFRIKEQKVYNGLEKKYIKDFVRFQNFVENNITKTTKVQDFANMMNVSTKTLNNITQHIVHKSAKAFIDDICTQRIKRLLVNTDFSIKEIAYTSGFEETTNFYKYFKRQTNLTPEQFRTIQ